MEWNHTQIGRKVRCADWGRKSCAPHQRKGIWGVLNRLQIKGERCEGGLWESFCVLHSLEHPCLEQQCLSEVHRVHLHLILGVIYGGADLKLQLPTTVFYNTVNRLGVSLYHLDQEQRNGQSQKAQRRPQDVPAESVRPVQGALGFRFLLSKQNSPCAYLFHRVVGGSGREKCALV